MFDPAIGADSAQRAKRLLRFLVLLPLLAALFVVLRPAEAVDPQPNILVIHTDDMRWDSLQYMPIVSDRLAAQGVTFENAFVTTPLCCPSRAGFLTGQYAHNTGVLSNQPPAGGFEAFNDTSTLATWLQGAGYTTSFVGKYLNLYPAVSKYVPPGWDDWHGNSGAYLDYNLNENGTVVHYGNAPEDYSTDVLRDRAISFIGDTPDNPFFMWLSFYAPHAPQTVAPRHVGSCDGITFTRPPSFNEADVSDKPAWVQDLPLAGPNRIASMEVEDRNRICSLKAVDEAIGAVLDSLGPRLDDTLVIFTSDNGLAWSEHRIRGKNCAYEECIRVPLLMRYPALIPAATTRSQFALNIDLAPTIAELTGAPIPTPVDGLSLLPVLADAGAPLRDEVLTEYSLDLADPSQGLVTAIRTAEAKYIEQPGGETELYDLAADPYELDNIVTNPDEAATVQDLSARLADLRVAGNGAPAIVSEPGTTATSGSPYTYEAHASGGRPLTWSLADAPEGMTVDAEGHITWTPEASGTYDVTLEATNAWGSGGQGYRITVVTAPVITSTPPTTGIQGEPYAYTPEAAGDTPMTWILDDAPSGMTIDPSTGVITWTPTAAGTFAARIVATNAVGPATQDFAIDVIPSFSAYRPVADGRNVRLGSSLLRQRRVGLVRASDNARLQVSARNAFTFRFRAAVPAKAKIRSVKVYVEHHEDPSMPANAVLWRATLGTLAKPAVFLAMLRPENFAGPRFESVTEWDLSAVIRTPSAANNLKFAIRNQSTNGAKTRIDRIYMVVTYIE